MRFVLVFKTCISKTSVFTTSVFKTSVSVVAAAHFDLGSADQGHLCHLQSAGQGHFCHLQSAPPTVLVAEVVAGVAHHVVRRSTGGYRSGGIGRLGEQCLEGDIVLQRGCRAMPGGKGAATPCVLVLCSKLSFSKLLPNSIRGAQTRGITAAFSPLSPHSTASGSGALLPPSITEAVSRIGLGVRRVSNPADAMIGLGVSHAAGTSLPPLLPDRTN